MPLQKAAASSVHLPRVQASCMHEGAAAKPSSLVRVFSNFSVQGMGLERRRQVALAMGRYGCRKVRVYPTECGQQLERDPAKKMGAPNPLF